MELETMQKRLAQINNKIAKDHSFLQTLPDEPMRDAGTGLTGNEDMGENSSIGGDEVKYLNKHHHNKHHHHAQTRTLPDTPYTNAGGNVGTNEGHSVTGMAGNEDLGEGAKVGGSNINFARRHPHHAQTQTQARMLPDEPYTLPNLNVATNGGD